MNTVLIFGTFDFLHSGHLHAFEEAKKLGDHLIVCVGRDKAVEEIKGTLPIHSEDERLRLVKHVDLVDDAFLGDEAQGIYSFFENIQPDVIALGYDQHDLRDDIEVYMKAHHAHAVLVNLPAYKQGDTKSSTIKHALGL
ncbi:MAG: FAD synthase [Candidatus Magasanikbacteria bacterium CG11_big_fil_rev_8_21_14_0_20_43_7]|uniref:FAD synthase n=1 Tax=Candidatus Magasanikbacteria bacterium CG11_big_fil_rev_8_21_14_0_20_43_7 TaxID=1974654 RepID=A0A2H0N2S2_9BACT|nr:MAG: FAD synthase [Candidatus Magasanikbacteria bacterium CG11_big_fil_rev_8_21_14_0_20_43_7]